MQNRKMLLLTGIVALVILAAALLCYPPIWHTL